MGTQIGDPYEWAAVKGCQAPRMSRTGNSLDADNASVRAAWLVNVDDAFEREMHWLAHFQSQEE